MDIMERELKDPNWRQRELDELAKPLEMEYSVEMAVAQANHQMRCREIFDSLSPDERKAFVAGLRECGDYWGETNNVERNLEETLHNIYDEWVKKANAEVARHTT